MENFIICQIWQNLQKSLDNLPTDKARNIVPSIYLENKPKEASAKNTYRNLRHCVTLMVIKSKRVPTVHFISLKRKNNNKKVKSHTFNRNSEKKIVII